MSAEDVVKSVGRVFAILELFDRRRDGLTATEVERALDWPKSSTLALLKSMVTLGYLSFDRIERRYSPTIRVARLGDWIDGADERRDLDALVEDCAAMTGQTVTISCENDLRMQFLLVEAGSRPLRMNINPGLKGPLFQSNMGRVALSTKSDAAIARLAERVNRRASLLGERVDDLGEVLTHVGRIREDGFSAGYGRFIPHIGVLSWPLRRQPNAPVLVLSIGGPVDEVRASEKEIAKLIPALLESHGFPAKGVPGDWRREPRHGR